MHLHVILRVAIKGLVRLKMPGLERAERGVVDPEGVTAEPEICRLVRCPIS